LLLHIDFRALFGVFENLISSQNQPFLLLKKTLSKNIHNKVYLDLKNFTMASLFLKKVDLSKTLFYINFLIFRVKVNESKRPDEITGFDGTRGRHRP
jgi:hypothetical protein